MTLTALAVPLPLTPESVNAHIALQFYSAYGQKFPKTEEQWQTQDFEEFYSADCKTILVDHSVLSGGAASWQYFRKLYLKYPKVERDILSIIVVSDDAAETHKIHAEFLTKLHTAKGVVELPQSFVYTLGKADEGKGTLGLQFRELRNYYDLRTLEEALGGPL